MTRDGKPISSQEIIEEDVKDFATTPADVRCEVTIIGEHGIPHWYPTGVLFYGFDAAGNVYYQVWDGSDDYWKQ